MNHFGMGIELALVDNMSGGLHDIFYSFRRVEHGAEDMINSVDSQMSALNMQAMGLTSMMYAGDQMVARGKGVLNYFKQFGQQVVSRGADFENYRITLGALYKDQELAEEKLQWAIDFGAKTPFDIKDTMSTMVGMKAIGVEVDELITTAGGHTQELLGFIGDLGALRPDVGIQRMAYAIRNALGGNTRSLVAALDVNVNQLLGRKFGGSGVEGIPQDIADLVEALGAEGLMESLFGTWNQMLAEIGDQMHKIFLFISDSGAFDSMKNVLKSLYDTIANITDEDLETMGLNISKIIEDLLVPVQWLADKGIKAFHWFTNLIKTQPELVGFIAKLIAMSGVMLIVVGAVMSLVAMIAMIPVSLKLAGFALKKFAGAMGIANAVKMSSIKILGLMIGKFALVIGGLFLLKKAFDTDFMGIRTIVTKTKDSFVDAFEMMDRSIHDFKLGLDRLEGGSQGNTFFDRFTLGIIKTVTFIKGLFDVLKDNEMDKGTYLQLEALGVLPLIDSIMDLKFQWGALFDGFRDGAKETLDTIKGIVDGLNTFLTRIDDFLRGVLGMDKVEDTLDGVNKQAGNLNLDRYYDLGKTISNIVAIVAGSALVRGIIKVSKLVIKYGGKIIGILGSAKAGTGIAGGLAALGAGLVAHPVVGIIFGILWVLGILYQNVEGFRDVVQAVWEYVEWSFLGTIEIIKDVIKWVGKLIGRFRDWLGLDGKTVEANVKYSEWLDGRKPHSANPYSNMSNIVNPPPPITKKTSPFRLPGASSGGYTKKEGLVNLHPNELIVDNILTQMLSSFLHREEAISSKPLITQRDSLEYAGEKESITNLISEKKTNISHVDSSINIEKGAIEVTLESGEEQDVEKLFSALWTKIERKREVENARNYKPKPI